MDEEGNQVEEDLSIESVASLAALQELENNYERSPMARARADAAKFFCPGEPGRFREYCRLSAQGQSAAYRDNCAGMRACPGRPAADRFLHRKCGPPGWCWPPTLRENLIDGTPGIFM